MSQDHLKVGSPELVTKTNYNVIPKRSPYHTISKEVVNSVENPDSIRLLSTQEISNSYSESQSNYYNWAYA